MMALDDASIDSRHVKLEEPMTEKITINRGVRDGDTTSPTTKEPR